MTKSIQDFINKASIIHNNLYDYIVDGKNVLIVCKKHGTFKQRKDYHLQGMGCKTCAHYFLTQKKTKTIKLFINQCNEIHNYKYDYSNSIYLNNKTKIIIGCPIHGTFEQAPFNHLTLKQGCPRCGSDNVSKSKLSDSTTFILKANDIHGNNYDYSKVLYSKNNIKVSIICKIHGEFLQTPHHHLRGGNCPRCARKNSSKLED